MIKWLIASKADGVGDLEIEKNIITGNLRDKMKLEVSLSAMYAKYK